MQNNFKNTRKKSQGNIQVTIEQAARQQTCWQLPLRTALNEVINVAAANFKEKLLKDELSDILAMRSDNDNCQNMLNNEDSSVSVIYSLRC